MEALKSENIIYVDTNDDLRTILSCFRVNRISHVPVMNENKIIGIVSKTDVVEYLYVKLEDLGGQTLDQISKSIKAKELMIQPLIEATIHDTEMTILEKLFSHQVSSVIIKDDNQKVVGILTEKDMIKYLSNQKEHNMTFGEKFGLHLVQWLDNNGIIKASKALGDIGI